MTIEKLQEILAKNPEQALADLQVSSFTLPKWSDLEKEYDPMQHSIQSTIDYPAKLNENNMDDFKRTSFGLQKLAVARIAQAMFAAPVTRNYTFDTSNQQQIDAVQLLESLFEIENYIDSENIERGKQLNASCQIVTIWSAVPSEIPIMVNNLPTKFKLIHKTYSEMEGYKIYAQTDSNGEILVISIFYTDSASKEHVDVYANTNPPQYLKYDKLEQWTLDSLLSNRALACFPALHLTSKEPVWGGTAGTNIVEQIEELISFQGLYIKKNAAPTFVLDYGDTAGASRAVTEEKSNDSRKIITVGKGGTMADVTWPGAGTAVKDQYQILRNAFFEQVQMPDISFANLINSNTSAENKELLFSDVKAKALDLGGEWSRFFYKEFLIVKAFAKVMFPSLASALDLISMRAKINPYSIKSKKETAEYVSLAGDAMSLHTKVTLLGEADNVDQEVETIEAGNSMNANQGI